MWCDLAEGNLEFGQFLLIDPQSGDFSARWEASWRLAWTLSINGLPLILVQDREVIKSHTVRHRWSSAKADFRIHPSLIPFC